MTEYIVFNISVTLGIAQLIFITYILFREVTLKSPVVFLWATLFVMFALPHFLTILIQDLNYSNWILIQASLFVIGFCFVYAIVRYRKKLYFINIDNYNSFDYRDKNLNSLFVILSFIVLSLSTLGVIYSTVKSQGGLLNTSWGGGHAIQRSYVSLEGLAQRLAITFSGLSLYFFINRKKILSIVVLFLFAFLCLVVRSRTSMLPILVFFITLSLLKIKRIKIKHILWGGGVSPF